MTPQEQFVKEREDAIAAYGKDKTFTDMSLDWRARSMEKRYVYNFDWMGRPIIQYPQDIVAVQELIWQTRPDLIIETGIAHGGSLILSASLLALLDMTDAIERGETIDPARSSRKVIGVDIDIREHNRAAIEAHPMASRIEMFQGSAIDPDMVKRVRAASEGYERVMVCLDSMHTHDHVLDELRAYAPMTTSSCYCVVFDTLIEDLPDDFFPDRPWGPGNSPKSAVHAYLAEEKGWEIDRAMYEKLQVSVCPDGFLKKL